MSRETGYYWVRHLMSRNKWELWFYDNGVWSYGNDSDFSEDFFDAIDEHRVDRDEIENLHKREQTASKYIETLERQQRELKKERENLRKEIERYRLLLPGLSDATPKFVANCTKCGAEFLCKIGAASMLCEACQEIEDHGICRQCNNTETMYDDDFSGGGPPMAIPCDCGINKTMETNQ